MTDVPVLETGRLIMRAFQPSDVEPMFAFFADEGSKFYGGPLDRAEAWRRLASYAGQWQLNGFGEWALQHRQSGKFLGFCGPWFPPELPEPEIAWALMPDSYGHGYATEAANRALQYVYQELGWSSAMSLIEPANDASIRLAGRLGATFEKPFREGGWDARIYRHLSPAEHAERLNYG